MPISPNIISSELLNTAAICLFRHLTWPTSVSIHDKTLKGGKIPSFSGNIMELPRPTILFMFAYNVCEISSIGWVPRKADAPSK